MWHYISAITVYLHCGYRSNMAVWCFSLTRGSTRPRESDSCTDISLYSRDGGRHGSYATAGHRADADIIDHVQGSHKVSNDLNQVSNVLDSN